MRIVATVAPTVARTMAERGEICPDCDHPWGRHRVDAGCIASHQHPGRKRSIVCSCAARPTRQAVRPPRPLDVEEYAHGGSPHEAADVTQ